jgi:hypothetical protein
MLPVSGDYFCKIVIVRNNLEVRERKVNHFSQSQSERCEKTAGGRIPAPIVHRHALFPQDRVAQLYAVATLE